MEDSVKASLYYRQLVLLVVTMDLRFIYVLALLGLVQSELVNLKCDFLKKFVDGHNSRRLRLAKGKVSGQPAASKMNSMVWNEELAALSASWAAQNHWGHNPNRTVPSHRFSVGENLFKISTTNFAFKFDPDMAMNAWFDEYKSYKYKKLEGSDFAAGKPMVGHYTQMAWSNSVYVGCAVSHFNEIMNGNNVFSYYVVCNYGPAGNVIGQTPYESGQASKTLTCGAGSDCKQPYGNSCHG